MFSMPSSVVHQATSKVQSIDRLSILIGRILALPLRPESLSQTRRGVLYPLTLAGVYNKMKH